MKEEEKLEKLKEILEPYLIDEDSLRLMIELYGRNADKS